MLQRKDIKNISELKNGFTHRWLEPDFISSSLNCFKFSSLCKNLCKTLYKLFKETKQLLGLGRCQSNSFDAQIADATITMIQHILLTMRYRVEQYETMPGLFSNVREATVQQRLDQRLWGLFIELMQIIVVLFEDIDEQILLEKIFHNDHVSQMINYLLSGKFNQIENTA